MGCATKVICKKCTTKYEHNEGGGFDFHLLHCETCGRERWLKFREIMPLHIAYVAGLSMPFSAVSQEQDKQIQEEYQGEAVSDDEYHRGIEQAMEKCPCGGSYLMDAPARCPKCRSKKYRDDPDELISVMYD